MGRPRRPDHAARRLQHRRQPRHVAAAKEKKVPFFAIGAAGASLTGKDCTPYTIHYGYDTTALGNGTATTILKQGGKTWFFLTADYAFGTQLQKPAERVVKAGGGKVVGAVRVPLGDLGLLVLSCCRRRTPAPRCSASPTPAATSSTRSRRPTEFGITKTMKPAALLAFISDIHAIGLETAQGLYLTTGWYWDLNDKTRAFAKRFFDKTGVEPTMNQAGLLLGDADLSQRRQGRRHDRPRQGHGRAA